MMIQHINLVTNKLPTQNQKTQNKQTTISTKKIDEVNISTKPQIKEIKKTYSPSFAGSGSN